MKRNKGFTLIELLVVIAIIGILSSVVLASLNSARAKSRDAKRVSDIKQLQLALELYFDDNGQYPIATTAALLVTPGYLPTIPTDPAAGNPPYLYFALDTNGVVATCESYHVMATLEQVPVDTGPLAADRDILAGELGTTCTGSATPDVVGLDPIYDVIP